MKKTNGNPFVNMGFWGPYGDRMMQRMLVIMWMLMPDGTRVRQQILGPPTIMQWVSCWLVFQCGMIMHGMADYQTMVDYMEFIKELAITHGPECWAIIFQAEARMRRTGLETIRRAADAKLDECVAAEVTRANVYCSSDPYEYNPAKPWDYCFKMAIFDDSPTSRRYWKKYVEIPCNAVNYNNHKVARYIQDDCKIAPTPEEHLATGGLAFDNSGIIAPQPHVEPKQPKAKATPGPPADKEGASKKDKNGNYTHNKKGTKLCVAFNNNGCKPKCPHNDAHQCNKCLLNNHGRSECGKPIAAKVKKGKK